MSEDKSTFRTLMRFLSTLDVNKAVTRKDILKLFKDDPRKPSHAYIDTTRRKLTASGYLGETATRGLYRINSPVPADLSSRALDHEYNCAIHSIKSSPDFRDHVLKVHGFMLDTISDKTFNKSYEMSERIINMIMSDLIAQSDGDEAYAEIYGYVVRAKNTNDFLVRDFIEYIMYADRFADAYNRNINKNVFIQHKPLKEQNYNYNLD